MTTINDRVAMKCWTSKVLDSDFGKLHVDALSSCKKLEFNTARYSYFSVRGEGSNDLGCPNSYFFDRAVVRVDGSNVVECTKCFSGGRYNCSHATTLMHRKNLVRINNETNSGTTQEDKCRIGYRTIAWQGSFDMETMAARERLGKLPEKLIPEKVNHL